MPTPTILVTGHPSPALSAAMLALADAFRFQVGQSAGAPADPVPSARVHCPTGPGGVAESHARPDLPTLAVLAEGLSWTPDMADLPGVHDVLFPGFHPAELAFRLRHLLQPTRASLPPSPAASLPRLTEDDLRYQIFVEHAPDAIWCCELREPLDIHLPEDEQIAWLYRHGELGECNAALLRWFGFPSHEAARGTTLGTLLPAADHRNLEQLRAFIRSGYQLRGAESFDVDREGRPRILLHHITGIVAGYHLYRVWCTLQDITRLKQFEGALQRSEEHLRLIIESATDFAIIATNVASEITLWSPGAENLFGYAQQEMLGQSPHRLYTPEDIERGEPESEARRALIDGRAADERWHVRKSGERFWSSGLVRPLRDANGGVAGFIKIARDETARQRFQERLERTVQERTAALSTLNEQLENYSFSVAHDLRAPIRIIVSYCNLLLEDYAEPLGEEGARRMGRVVKAAQRMDNLVTGLLTYSRTLTTSAPTSVIDLLALVRESMEKQRHAIESTGAMIEIETPLPRVLGMTVLLAQVMDNLLGNALKFMAPGVRPLLRLRGETRGDRVRFSVIDNGIGIALEHQQRIFEPLKRLHAEHEYEGYGLGLSIAQRALQRMGGELGVVSAPDQGSTFWFELPLAAAPAASEEPIPAAP